MKHRGEGREWWLRLGEEMIKSRGEEGAETGMERVRERGKTDETI